LEVLRLHKEDIFGCSNIEDALECDCIIMAVPHQIFKELAIEERIANSQIKAVIDCKNVIDKEMMNGKVYKCLGNGDGI